MNEESLSAGMTKVSEDNYTMKVDIKPKIIMRLFNSLLK